MRTVSTDYGVDTIKLVLCSVPGFIYEFRGRNQTILRVILIKEGIHIKDLFEYFLHFNNRFSRLSNSVIVGNLSST